MKITKLSLALATLLTFANATPVEFAKSSNYHQCLNGFEIQNNKNESLFKIEKGNFATFDDLQLLSFANFKKSLPNSDNFASLVFLKNGFYFENRLYIFKNNFSKNFENYLNYDYRFNIFCKSINNNSVNIMSQTNNDIDLLMGVTELSQEFQNEIEHWVSLNALHLLLMASDGGFTVNNAKKIMIKNIEIEDLKKINEDLKIEIKKEKNEILKKLEIEKKENEIAKIQNKNPRYLIHQEKWKKFLELEKIIIGVKYEN